MLEMLLFENYQWKWKMERVECGCQLQGDYELCVCMMQS